MTRAGAGFLAVGDGGVGADVGLGQKVENRCDIFVFDVGEDHPGVRPYAVA